MWRILCRCERVLLLRADRADRLTVVAIAVVVVPGHVVRKEAEVPRAVRVALEERRRPIGAVAVDTAKTLAAAKARNGKKNGVAVRFACYLVAFDTVLCGPSPRTILE